MTKNTPEKATGTLVSVIAHITADELRSAVDRIALTNGLLNRVLFALVKRARLLPHGGWPDPMKLQRIGVELDEAVKAAQAIGAMSMTGDAADLWASIYPALTTDHPGLFGSLVARAEAHVVRLALLYALADCRRAIEPVHLEAALAVWRYSEASARILFGDLTGEPVSDDMLALLRMAGAVGMTRTELLNDVGRHVTRRRIQAGLDLLRRIGCARRSVRIDPHVPGPAAEVWTYVPPGRR